MAVLKSLSPPENVQTSEGKKRATHEAYNYVITPYSSPPIQLEIVKGNITNGKFKPLMESSVKFQVSLDEFKILISRNDKGKPAGDFRLSDILKLVQGRNQTPPETITPVAENAVVPEKAD